MTATRNPKDQAPIPPLSEVRVSLVTTEEPEWAEYLGRVFRVGYYGQQDGLDCVWLVSDDGDYGEAIDQEMIRTHFEVLRLSEETDFFGVHRDIIGPRRTKAGN